MTRLANKKHAGKESACFFRCAYNFTAKKLLSRYKNFGIFDEFPDAALAIGVPQMSADVLIGDIGPIEAQPVERQAVRTFGKVPGVERIYNRAVGTYDAGPFASCFYRF